MHVFRGVDSKYRIFRSYMDNLLFTIQYNHKVNKFETD